MILLKSRVNDLKIIGFFCGKIIIAVGICMVIPMALSFLLGQPEAAVDFIIGFSFALTFGFLLLRFCRTAEDPDWKQGMAVVALSWLLTALVAAIPLFLSGHYLCFLDAYFEAMSGFSTTGLSLTQDIDHMAEGHNLWRHLLQFLGGQGIVVLALSFLIGGASGAFRLYSGEARDERVLPNVINTARFIWLVGMVYFFLGATALGITGIIIGLPPGRSFFDAACIFMACFDTGGFTPRSQSIQYYHSIAYELVTVIIMIMGALNFKLHYELWQGNRKELRKNLEILTFTFSVILLFCLAAAGLSRAGVYPSSAALFRRGFYQFISAHSGTGFQTVYPGQFLREWPDFSLAALIIAMGLGGAICSTTGGIKMLRLGIIFKSLLLDLNKIFLPRSSVLVEKFHHIKDIVLEDKLARSAMFIAFLYLALYLAGAMIGMFLGYPFLPSLFESISAGANVGLSCGITGAGMPALLKITYILQMWAGRLEFFALFILAGFIIAIIKGK